MNLTPSLRRGAFCCALTFPAFLLFQFFFATSFRFFPELPVKSQIAAVTDTCVQIVVTGTVETEEREPVANVHAILSDSAGDTLYSGA